MTKHLVYANNALRILSSALLDGALGCQVRQVKGFCRPFGTISTNRFLAFTNINMSSDASARFGTMERTQGPTDHFFRQLFDRESCTYSYLLADIKTKKAVIIDPVVEHAKRDAKQIDDLGLELLYSVNTHLHADHITGSGLLKKLFPNSKSVISKKSGAKADVYVAEGDVIKFGNQSLEVRETPGHTNGCVTFVSRALACAFTGDTVLIRGCGRTDFQEGDPETLYDSVWNQVLSLPDSYKIYPAHDYTGRTESSVAEEKAFNPRLTKSKADFVNIMNNLGLSYPKKIDASLPANKVCGMYELPDEIKKMYDEA